MTEKQPTRETRTVRQQVEAQRTRQGGQDIAEIQDLERRREWEHHLRGGEGASMKRCAKSREATAYHEAGHVVMAWHERVRVSAVSIVPDDDSRGRAYHGYPLRRVELEWDNSLRARGRMESCVMVWLAGPIAQQLARPRTRLGAGDDWHQANDLLSYFCTPGGEGFYAYRKLLSIWTRSALRKPHIWELVEAVAHALLSQERLTGAEVRTLIRKTLAAQVPRIRPNETNSVCDKAERTACAEHA